MATNPPKVVTRPVDYAALVRKVEGEEFKKPEPSYEFSNGRNFNSTDDAESGIYRR